MLLLKEVKEWLIGLVPSAAGYIEVGRSFQTEQYVGVYGREQTPDNSQLSVMGGINAVKRKEVAIYIRWGAPEETEKKAAEVYQALHGHSNFLLNGFRICFVDPGAPPAPSGKEKEGVHEYVLYPTFYYERKEDV